MRFIPSGYIDLEQGILLIAKLRTPAHWLQETMLPGEQEVWDGIGRTLNAGTLDPLLFEVSTAARRTDPSISTSPMITRLADYGDAFQDLRRALHQGIITAVFLDDAGKFGWIRKDGWGTDAGETILMEGVADLADDTPLGKIRVPLLRVSDLEHQLGLATIAARPVPDPVIRSGDGLTARAANKGGRPPEYNWPAIKEFARAQVAQHGMPGRDNVRLPTKEDLARIIVTHWSDRGDLHPSISNVRKKLTAWMQEFRQCSKPTEGIE